MQVHLGAIRHCLPRAGPQGRQSAVRRGISVDSDSAGSRGQGRPESTGRPEIMRSHGGRWKTHISRYIAVMPSIGKTSGIAEQIISAPPPAKVTIAMMAKIGAAARHSQLPMLAALSVGVLTEAPCRVWPKESMTVIRGRIRREAATRCLARCGPGVRGRATDTRPKYRPRRVHSWSRCGRPRRHRARRR